MTQRDTTPVTVTLDRQRPYRVNDEDRSAVWVGPGEAEVPKWVAEHWGMTTTKQVKEDEQPPVTVETVTEKPLETVETVEIMEAAPKPKGKAK